MGTNFRKVDSEAAMSARGRGLHLFMAVRGVPKWSRKFPKACVVTEAE